MYNLERIELSVGETVRINRNNPQLDLTNGDQMVVTSIKGGTIQLEHILHKNDTPLPSLQLSGKTPLHLEYGYCSTVHGSQGLTSDRVYVALDTKSRTTSMNLYYVAISRARHEARIYTDSLKALPSAIAKRYNKTSALELQMERKWQKTPQNIATGNMGITPQQQNYPTDKKQQYQYGDDNG